MKTETQSSAELSHLCELPDLAEDWGAPDSKVVHMFALAVSVAAGRPIGSREHEAVQALAKPTGSSGSG